VPAFACSSEHAYKVALERVVSKVRALDRNDWGGLYLGPAHWVSRRNLPF
jgi:hypothetical protein